jgi:hypothetical protein
MFLLISREPTWVRWNVSVDLAGEQARCQYEMEPKLLEYLGEVTAAA